MGDSSRAGKIEMSDLNDATYRLSFFFGGVRSGPAT